MYNSSQGILCSSDCITEEMKDNPIASSCKPDPMPCQPKPNSMHPFPKRPNIPGASLGSLPFPASVPIPRLLHACPEDIPGYDIHQPIGAYVQPLPKKPKRKEKKSIHKPKSDESDP